jgi:methylmalonyl-CoA mutase
MTDLSIAKKLLPYKPKHKVRFVTAASLFDGHDASINIMRRILQSTGAEVIHLGHNRSVQEIVNAALQEDVQGIAITSYQGGHVEFFKYMIDLLRAGGGENIQVFGGGGGVIVPSEIDELHAYGVTRVYSPQDGQSMGLQGMINEVVTKSDFDLSALAPQDPEDVLSALKAGDRRKLAQAITALENGAYPEALRKKILHAAAGLKVPTLGITGTGGAGKSSLTDELVRRFRLDQGDTVKLAIISIDPSRKRTGGALLGDRIRMNAIEHPNIYMRSLATRETGSELSAALPEVIAACKLAGFDLVIVETSGIGQGNAAIVPLVDVSLYVMTPEFGAASQLEKIDMLDFADFVAINKFDRKGAEDALRDVRKQYQRNHEAFTQSPDEMPVFGTMAARFNDDGVTGLYQAIVPKLQALGLKFKRGKLPLVNVRQSSNQRAIVPAQRVRYLAEIAEAVRSYHAHTAKQAEIARQRQALRTAKTLFQAQGKAAGDFDEMISWKMRNSTPGRRSCSTCGRRPSNSTRRTSTWSRFATRRYAPADQHLALRIAHPQGLAADLRGRRRSAAFPDEGEHSGLFPVHRRGLCLQTRERGSDPHVCRRRRCLPYQPAVQEGFRRDACQAPVDGLRLGHPLRLRSRCPARHLRQGGQLRCFDRHLDDMKVLFDGFELCAPTTSVSLTINGPAPIILSMFFNTAMDQQVEKFRSDNGREPTEDEIQKIRVWVLANVRGTVQADILKEDQGQNTCIFSTEFALKMMGDIQEFFVHNHIGNFYSVSISGYHIAEAGANPISQLAFTLANGFTYVETYLARGMHIDDFAPNLSFFFSNGMDPEYSVIGRVARRIWAVAMKNKYGGNERSQKLKYHIQTSGRSLHAQEMAFNDIRTTLQALIAIYDNCNSLHTNAYDEAITTPTEESVRRAMAIQLIINREWGLAMNENPNQGSFIIEELTDLVEEAVLKEFEAIASRGGVLGAMETGYQRGKIQEESLYYEHKKHDGSFPIVGVNTFRNPKGDAQIEIELARSTEEEKQSQLTRLRDFQSRNAAPPAPMIEHLKQDGHRERQRLRGPHGRCARLLARADHHALYEVGGQYRRSM